MAYISFAITFAYILGLLLTMNARLGKPLAEALPNRQNDFFKKPPDGGLAILALLGVDDEINAQVERLHLQRQVTFFRFLSPVGIALFVVTMICFLRLQM